MRMDIIATAIEDAIEKRCFLPALSLSLVIPDICAKYDYPDIYIRNLITKDIKDKVLHMLNGMMKTLEIMILIRRQV